MLAVYIFMITHAIPDSGVTHAAADGRRAPGVIGLLATRFAGETTRCCFTAGERLWHAGRRADHLTFIEHGIVKLEQLNATGEVFVVGVFGAADSIGLALALGRQAHAADAVALTRTVIATRVRAEPVLRALPDSAALTIALNQELVHQASLLDAKIAIVCAGTVPRRLATLLLHLAARFGRGAGDDVLRIEIGLTRELIGQFVGARVETVIRILSRWQKAGWLAGGRDGIHILRPDMLRRVLGT